MKRFLLGICVISAFWLISCNRCDDPTDPNCRNFDPCFGLGKGVTADFDMFEVNNSRWPEIKVKTGVILDRRTLILVPNDTFDVEHQWIIGTDPRIREGEVEVVTFGFPAGRIKITHIVSGNPMTACQDEDDGKDTVIQ